MQNDTELVDIFGGDLSRFQLSTGAYYLCRNDFFELMETGKGTLGWFSALVGHTVDHTEVRGWRKTGRSQPSDQSFTELKTIRCIIHGPESEHFYKIAEMSKSSFVNETGGFTPSIHNQLERRLQTGTDFQSRSEVDSKGFHKGENPTMRAKMITKIRFVKCPRCLNVLPEPPDVPVYTCGGCGARLRAKVRAEPICQTDDDITSQTDTDISSSILTDTDIPSPTLTDADTDTEITLPWF